MIFDKNQYKKEEEQFVVGTFWNFTFFGSAIIMIMANTLFFMDITMDYDFKFDLVFYLDILLAFGVPLCWINVLYNTNANSQWRLICITLKYSLFDCSRYFLEVAPIFIGFTFFGFCSFNYHARYESVYETLISLLSIFAGDEIQPSIQIYAEVGFEGYIFGMAFTLFFFVVVQNIMVLLVTTCYERAIDEQKKVDKVQNGLKVLEKAKDEGWAYNTQGVITHINDPKSYATFSNMSDLKFLEKFDKKTQNLTTNSNIQSQLNRNQSTPNIKKAQKPELSLDLSKTYKRQITADILKSSRNTNRNNQNLIHNELDTLNNYFNDRNATLGNIKTTKFNFDDEKTAKLIRVLEEKLVSKEVHELKDSLTYQIQAKSKVKHTNLWRQVRQFEYLVKDFHKFILDVYYEENLDKKEELKIDIIKNGKKVIKIVMNKLEFMRCKCWKNIEKYENKQSNKILF